MDKIMCVGKNYLDHAKELGDAIPEKPVFFIKPQSVLRYAKNHEKINLRCPSLAESLHFETEIVIRLGKGGYKLNLQEAQGAIDAVTIGLDMTLRDLQNAQKKAGHPWTTSKVFIDSAVIGEWRILENEQNYLEKKFSFLLNGKEAQSDYGRNMRFSPAECLSMLSHCFPVCEGDILFTGTPAGVGNVQAGDQAELRFLDINYFVEWQKD